MAKITLKMISEAVASAAEKVLQEMDWRTYTNASYKAGDEVSDIISDPDKSFEDKMEDPKLKKRSRQARRLADYAAEKATEEYGDSADDDDYGFFASVDGKGRIQANAEDNGGTASLSKGTDRKFYSGEGKQRRPTSPEKFFASKSKDAKDIRKKLDTARKFRKFDKDIEDFNSGKMEYRPGSGKWMKKKYLGEGRYEGEYDRTGKAEDDYAYIESYEYIVDSMTNGNWSQVRKLIGKYVNDVNDFIDFVDEYAPEFSGKAREICGIEPEWPEDGYSEEYLDEIVSKGIKNLNEQFEGVSDTARELILFADNERVLYDNYIRPYEELMARKIAKGIEVQEEVLSKSSIMQRFRLAATKLYSSRFGRIIMNGEDKKAFNDYFANTIIATARDDVRANSQQQ